MLNSSHHCSFFPRTQDFSDNLRFLAKVFFAAPEARTGKKYRVIDINPTAIGGRPARLFSICATETNEWVPVQQAWQR